MSTADLMNRRNANLLFGALSTSVIGDFRLFNNSLLPEYGYLKQGTGPYNVSNYPKLGAAYVKPVLTTSINVSPITGYKQSWCYSPTLGMYVGLLGSGANAVYSTNGTTWNNQATGMNASQFGYLLWTGQRFISVGYGTGANKDCAIYSTNATAWTSVTLPIITGGYYACATNGNGVVIAFCGSNNSVAVSTDHGSTWALKSNVLPSIGAYEGVGYGNGTWVAFMYGSTTAAYSTNNGTTWTPVTLPFTMHAEYITYANGIFIATSMLATENRYLISTDGITWTAMAKPFTGSSCWQVSWNGNAFLMLSGLYTGYYSVDGINWTSFTLPNPGGENYQTQSCGGNGKWVISSTTTYITTITYSLSNTFSVPSITAPTGFEYWVKAIDSTPISSLTISPAQTTSFTALANYEYPIDSTSSAITMTLPAAPKNGDKIIALDFKLNFAINSLTINRNGNKINNMAENLIINTKGAGVSLVYIESLNSWAMEYNCTPSSLPVTVILSGDNLTASALSTSLSAFNAASANSVVPITAAEFANLIAISSTTTIGASSSSMDLDVGGNGTNGAGYVTSIGGTSLNGAKIVGFRALVNNITTVEIWQTTNTAVGGTATKLYTGNATAPGLCFFVIKTPTAVVGAQFLAINNSTSSAIKTSTGSFTFAGAYANPPATGTVTFTTTFSNIQYPLIQLISRLT